ncbi:MAG: hypothetical protein EXR75_05555 [Myxococcales bacterium]|nr:hypothetical protein [Myxococcales bacterium]
MLSATRSFVSIASPRLLAGLSAALLFLQPNAAGAAPDLTVDEGQSFSISGDKLFGKVLILGTLRVTEYDAADANTGWIRLRAASLDVTATGKIDARGSGYRGAKRGRLEGQPGAGGSPLPASMGLPTAGGGGGHLGKGGSGSLAGCGALIGATGGLSYDDAAMPLGVLGLGSAGGASYAGNPNPMYIGAGAHGGGVILIEAATVTLNGELDARGADATATLKTSPGGGAGGSVLVLANAFTFGAAGLITAAGGTGAVGNAIGGSGGGGLVRLTVAPAIEPDAITRVDVLGGASAEPMCKSARGDDGDFVIDSPAGCVDADKDGHGTDDCDGGDDCDDVDAGVSPATMESCNGRDDDCSGAADDAPALCPVGERCESGSCVEVEPPSGEGGGVSGTPEIELRGGLCTITREGTGNAAKVSASIMGVFAALLGLRRRPDRRSPSTRPPLF